MDDVIEDVARAILYRIEEIGYHMENGDTEIIKITHARCYHLFNHHTAIGIFIYEEDIKNFLKYSTNERARTKFMATILGAKND